MKQLFTIIIILSSVAGCKEKRTSPTFVSGDSAVNISTNDSEIIFAVDTSEIHTRWYETGDTLHIRKLIKK